MTVQFRVLFDKIASVYISLLEKYIYILALEIASQSHHCANCIGTLSFPILGVCRPNAAPHRCDVLTTSSSVGLMCLCVCVCLPQSIPGTMQPDLHQVLCMLTIAVAFGVSRYVKYFRFYRRRRVCTRDAPIV